MSRILVALSAAFLLAVAVGSVPTPVGAQTTCPGDQDCDGIPDASDPCPAIPNAGDQDCDGIPDASDPCPTTPNAGDADCDGIPNAQDNCDNLLDPVGCADDDEDGIVNKDDACDTTDTDLVGLPLVIGSCTVQGVTNTIAPNGCSVADLLAQCETGATNHGKYVSCIAKATNAMKKAGSITGAQKGQIQSCAARSDVGKKPKPPKP